MTDSPYPVDSVTMYLSIEFTQGIMKGTKTITDIKMSLFTV